VRGERARHVVLIGPALLHQADHRVRFGQAIADLILGEHDPRDDHEAMAVLRADQTAVVDESGLLVAARFREQVSLVRLSRHGGRVNPAGWASSKRGQFWVRTPDPAGPGFGADFRRLCQEI
jgi:hypothetical protein